MPGTILVSVLELSDLPSASPSPGRDASFHLKVALGRRQFRTHDGVGDFSFPVSSLRDNLILTLHDAEENEISRAVVQIVRVMENGFWDSWFSLEGGGNVHMTFQFSLNEDERKRIFEKREYAVKKKYTDLINSGGLSFSDDILRSPTQEAALDLHNALHLTGHSVQIVPDASGTQLVNLRSEEPQQRSYFDSTQSPLLTKSLTNVEGLREPEGERLNPNSPDTGPAVSGNLIASQHSLLLSVDEHYSRKQNNISSASVVKKMIDAFETSLSQEKTPRPHMEPANISRLGKLESMGRLKEAHFEGMHFKMGQEQCSEVGTLPCRKFEDRIISNASANTEPSEITRLNAEYGIPGHVEEGISGDVFETSNTLWIVKSCEKGENHISDALANEEQTTSGVMHVETLHGSCVDDPFLPEEEQKSCNPSIFLVKSSSADFSDNQCSSKEEEREEPAQFLAIETTDRCGKLYGSSTSMEQSANTVGTGTDDAYGSPENMLVALSICQVSKDEVSSSIVTYKGQHLAVCDAASMEASQRTWVSSKDLLDKSTETWLLWYPSFWKRRPCITTAAGQFIDILDGFNIVIGSHPKTKTDLNVTKEFKNHGGLPDNTVREKDTPCVSRPTNSECIISMLKFSGGLIKQGLKVIILFVACGTFILNAT